MDSEIMQSPQQVLNKSNSKAVLRQPSMSKLPPPAVNTKTQLKNLLEKVKSLTVDDTTSKQTALTRKKSLAELETIKSNDKVQKSREYLLSMVESFNQQSEKMPRWRFKLNGIMNPDEKLILKGKALWRAITKAYIGLAIRPILIKNKIKLITRDQECLELAKAIHIYSESCDFWLGKLVQVPLTSLCQDSSLDFVPQTFMRRSIKERRKIQLKVRVYAMINAIISSGDPPDHIIKFLASLTEDENYFPSGFLFRVERKALILDKLGATQQMVTHVPVPVASPTNTHHRSTSQNNNNQDSSTVTSPTITTPSTVTPGIDSSKSTTVTEEDKDNSNHNNQKSDFNINNNGSNSSINANNNINDGCNSMVKQFHVQLADPRLFKGGGGNNGNNTTATKRVRTFDASRVKMMVSNFLIVRILINHLCLCPWKHTGYPPDEEYEAKCIVNSRILATLLYEIVRNIDGSVLPSIDSADMQQQQAHNHDNRKHSISHSQYQRGVSDLANSTDAATTKDKKRLSISTEAVVAQNVQDVNNNNNSNNIDSPLKSVYIPIQPSSSTNITTNNMKLSSTSITTQKPTRSILMRIAIGFGFRDDTIKIIEEDKVISKEIATYLTGNRDSSSFCTFRELFHVLYPLEFLKIGFGSEVIAEWVKELAPLLNTWIEAVTLSVLMKQQDKLFQYFDIDEDSTSTSGSGNDKNKNKNGNNQTMKAYYLLKDDQKKQKEQLKNYLITESVKNTLIKQQKNENIMQFLNNSSSNTTTGGGVNQKDDVSSLRSNNNKTSPRVNNIVHFQELTKVYPLTIPNSQITDSSVNTLKKQKPYV